MARASIVTVLGGAALLLAACTGGTSSAQPPGSIGSGQPSTQASASPSAQASASPAAAELPGLAVQSTIAGVTYPAALIATDDAVWALGHTDARWSRIDPATNAITDSVSIGGASATGGVLADKKLWALDFTDQQVVGVDPVTRKVVAKVPVGLDGGWLVAGEGALWAIGNDSHELVRIDPKTLKVSRLALDAKCGSTPLAAGGAVWMVAPTGHLCKLDPKTGRIVAELDGVGDNAQWLFWAANRVMLPNDEGGVVIVDPEAMTIEAVVPPPPAGTFGGDKFSMSSPGSQQSVSMLDADPNVWVRYTGATVGRLDSGASTWTVYAGLPLGNDGAPMLLAFDSFWAADVNGNAIIRAEVPAP